MLQKQGIRPGRVDRGRTVLDARPFLSGADGPRVRQRGPLGFREDSHARARDRSEERVGGEPWPDRHAALRRGARAGRDSRSGRTGGGEFWTPLGDRRLRGGRRICSPVLGQRPHSTDDRALRCSVHGVRGDRRRRSSSPQGDRSPRHPRASSADGRRRFRDAGGRVVDGRDRHAGASPPMLFSSVRKSSRLRRDARSGSCAV